jgi:hypothetical protein
VRITIDPNIRHGKHVVRGLRYPVKNVLEWLASGMTHGKKEIPISPFLALTAHRTHTTTSLPIRKSRSPMSLPMMLSWVIV